ncbi:MAG: class II aldolase/adducin family protein [Clostridia bacterium]|nr:class II aldolase/adducin family protein [Clostridia bacterium]
MKTALREKIVQYGRNLLANQLVVGTWGNISCKTADETIIITPSGVDYNRLKPEDLLEVTAAGKILTGNLKPSSELLMHVAIYQGRKDIQAVIHTHSIYSTCCGVLRQPIPPLVEDIAMVIGGTIEVAEYFLAGTEELGQAAVRALGQKNAVLLANHGVVGVGPNLKEALKAALLTEKAAQVYLTTIQAGKPYLLSEKDVAILHNTYLTSYGQKGGKENNEDID